MMAAPVDNLGVRLSLLFEGIPYEGTDASITDLSLNSRRVTPGCLYLACQGARHHGLEFADQALERGAACIAWDPADGQSEPTLPPQVVGLRVPGLARHVGTVAHRFFGRPSQEISVTGITGTNGKTTVAWLCAGASTQLAQPAAYMGTLGYGPLDDLADARRSSQPDLA